MALGLGLALGLEGLGAGEVKVNDLVAARVHAVEGSDVSDRVERGYHGDWSWAAGMLTRRDHLGGGVLDLETRVELEEGELADSGE